MLDRQRTADAVAARIMCDPDFRTLVRERTRFGWVMSAAMLVVYLGFIFLAALDNGLMSSTVGGSAVSWGVVYGIVVIVFAFVLTGVYVARANGRFDDLAARIEKDVR